MKMTKQEFVAAARPLIEEWFNRNVPYVIPSEVEALASSLWEMAYSKDFAEAAARAQRRDPDAILVPYHQWPNAE